MKTLSIKENHEGLRRMVAFALPRRTRYILVASVIAVVLALFFLPVLPVQVEPFGRYTSLNVQERGYPSLALYFSGCGGIYVTADAPNFAALYVGYCVILGGPFHTTFGWDINEL